MCVCHNHIGHTLTYRAVTYYSLMPELISGTQRKQVRRKPEYKSCPTASVCEWKRLPVLFSPINMIQAIVRGHDIHIIESTFPPQKFNPGMDIQAKLMIDNLLSSSTP